MEIYDLLGCFFILLEIERKGGGVFLSSTLEPIQVTYCLGTHPAVEPQKTTPP